MTFEQQHRDVLEALPDLKFYKSLSITGRVIEAWEKREDGKWHDVTLREQELQRAQEEVKRLKRKLAELNIEEEQDDNIDSENY